MRLDQVLNGLEVVINKKVKNKAEMKDIEALDKSKADISEM
jgi:hypothetical protein